MRNTGCFFGEIISSFEISAEDPHLTIHVTRQQQLSVFISELAVYAYGGRSSNRRYLTGHFTALLEASYRAMENDKIRSIR